MTEGSVVQPHQVNKDSFLISYSGRKDAKVPSFWIHSPTNQYTCYADCEEKAKAGNACAASFDWSCSGICRSVERIRGVHERCTEGEEAVWNITL